MKRKNKAGRPPLFAKTMVAHLVILDPITVKKAKKLGAGNLSKGIRQAFAVVTSD